MKPHPLGASLVAQWWRTHLQCRRPWFDSWVGKICWRRDRLPTPVFLGFPGGSAGKESSCNVWALHPLGPASLNYWGPCTERLCSSKREATTMTSHLVDIVSLVYCMMAWKIILSPQLLLQQRVTPTCCNCRKPMQSNKDPVQTK